MYLSKMTDNSFSYLLNGNLTAESVSQRELRKRVCSTTQRHLDMYARDGLRTLCFAKKVNYSTQIYSVESMTRLCVSAIIAVDIFISLQMYFLYRESQNQGFVFYIDSFSSLL